MFIAIRIRESFSRDYSSECLIDTSAIKMLIKSGEDHMIETTVGGYRIDKQSYDDIRKVIYGVQKN